jgi:hypothetical protein
MPDEIDENQSPSDKIDEIERKEAREKRITFMVNVTNIIEWFKNRRKKKDEENIYKPDSIDQSIDDAINRMGRRSGTSDGSDSSSN